MVKNTVEKAIKFVKEGRKVIFAEKKDVESHYKKLNFPNLIFCEATDKNDVFWMVKQENSSFYGLMDRDFIHNEEKKKIEISFPRLFILPFYNIETLLYHPDNLKEFIGNYESS